MKRRLGIVFNSKLHCFCKFPPAIFAAKDKAISIPADTPGCGDDLPIFHDTLVHRNRPPNGQSIENRPMRCGVSPIESPAAPRRLGCLCKPRPSRSSLHGWSGSNRGFLDRCAKWSRCSLPAQPAHRPEPRRTTRILQSI